MNDKNIFKILIPFLPIIIIAFLMAMNTASIPPHSDDILYEYYYPEIPVPDVPHGVVKDHPIDKAGDIISSIYHHYFNMNGRAPVHFVVQLFCGIFGKNAFAVISAFFLIAFILLSGFLSLGKRVHLYTLPYLILMLFFIEPGINNSVAGGVNYLWSSVMCLLFWYFLTDNRKTNFIWTIPLALLSFFAGWSFEGIVIPLSVAILSFDIRNFRNLSIKHILMTLFWGIGAALLVFSPANFQRAGEDVGLSVHSVAHFFRLVGCFYIMIALLLVLAVKSLQSLKLFINENVDIILALIGGILFFSLLGELPRRGAYGVELISALLCCKVLLALFSDKTLKVIGIVSSVVALSLMTCVYTFQQKANEQLYSIITQIEHCQTDTCYCLVEKVEYPKFLKRYLSRGYSDIELYKWWNECVWSWKYGKTVKMLPRPILSTDTAIPGFEKWYYDNGYWYSEKPFPTSFQINYKINYKTNFKYRMIRWYKELITHESTNNVHHILYDVKEQTYLPEFGLYMFYFNPQTWIIEGVQNNVPSTFLSVPKV